MKAPGRRAFRLSLKPSDASATGFFNRSKLLPTRGVVLAAFSLFLVVSCTTKGDFGRERPSATESTFFSAIRNYVAQSNGEPISAFALTEKERQLRNHHHRLNRDVKQNYFETLAASLGLAGNSSDTVRENRAASVEFEFPEELENNPYALASEIDEDVVIIGHVVELNKLILADDYLRSQRLATLKNNRQQDRDSVLVRSRENRQVMNQIISVARARVTHYNRIIDSMSIADPALAVAPARTLAAILKKEIDRIEYRQRKGKKYRPVRPTKSA